MLVSMTLKPLLKLMLLCGLMQACIYFLLASMASPTPALAVPQPDTLLYCQSARQIASGMPFVFTPGDKPSTGCTSHLYPFILALPYWLGAHDDALVTVGFFLNALFYLIFLFNWCVIIQRLLPSARSHLAAGLLLALNGHSVYCALAQSDVGFFMAVSSTLFAALLTQRQALFAVLLILAPWCRPEGMMLGACYAGALVVRRFLQQQVERREWIIAGGALLSAGAVFAFNIGLTGTAQFHSVLYKGHFQQQPFFLAVYHTAADALDMGKGIFLGMPGALPRDSYVLPLLGALFAWGGLALLPRKRSEGWREGWWLAAALLGYASVASSGWQGTNQDRYLAWCMPIGLLYIAYGIVWVGERLPGKRGWIWMLSGMAAFQVFGAVTQGTIYAINCQVNQQSFDGLRSAGAHLPAQAKIGGPSSAFVYAWPGHRFVHLSGIYSPEFLSADPITNIERLKHDPAKRFDAWSLPTRELTMGVADISPLCGQPLALNVKDPHMRMAKWEVLDRAIMPVIATNAGQRLVERLDVGYQEDERRCAYRTFSRFHGVRYPALCKTGEIGGQTLLEIGRPVLGWEEMVVALPPGKETRVVLRTAGTMQYTAQGAGYFDSNQTLSFQSPLNLRIFVDGTEMGIVSLPISTNDTAFSEVTFAIPGTATTAARTKLEIFGDHVSFSYWFFQ